MITHAKVLTGDLPHLQNLHLSIPDPAKQET